MSKNNLTPKQRIFIVEYLVDKNATKAAIRAGYSAKTAKSAGSRLLTYVDISTAIEKGLAEQLERADVSADLVLLELRRIALSEVSDSSCVNNSRKMRALELLGKSLGLFSKNEPVSEPPSMLGLLSSDSRRGR